jgi:hypothetical protein
MTLHLHPSLSSLQRLPTPIMAHTALGVFRGLLTSLPASWLGRGVLSSFHLITIAQVPNPIPLRFQS